MQRYLQQSQCLIAQVQLLTWISGPPVVSAVFVTILIRWNSYSTLVSETQSADWCRSVKSKVEVASVSNQTISGPDGNEVPIRIYHPADAKARKQGLPILVYCHGGGFFAGGLDTHDDLCRNLGHLSAYIVIAVDYRYLSNLLTLHT